MERSSKGGWFFHPCLPPRSLGKGEIEHTPNTQSVPATHLQTYPCFARRVFPPICSKITVRSPAFPEPVFSIPASCLFDTRFLISLSTPGILRHSSVSLNMRCCQIRCRNSLSNCFACKKQNQLSPMKLPKVHIDTFFPAHLKNHTLELDLRFIVPYSRLFMIFIPFRAALQY